MGVYLIALFLSLFFAFFSAKIKNKIVKIVFIIFSMMPFLILSAFRYDVGTDYLDRYALSYRIIGGGGDVPSLEILFKFLIKICLLFTKDSIMLFLVTSLLIVAGFYTLIFKHSKIPCLSILLLFCLGFYFQSLNLVRQYLAIVLVLFAFFSLQKNKRNIAIILYLIACFIHSSSFVTIFYWVLYCYSKEKKNENILFLIIILFSVCVFHSPITIIFRTIIKNTSFSSYLGSIFDISQFNIFSFILHSIFLHLMLIIRRNNNFNDKLSNFYFQMQMCTLVFSAFSSIFSLFNRIMCYFSIFLIFSIPYYVSNIKNIKKKMMICFIIICLSVFNIINTNILHNYNEVIPYKSVFDK